MKTAHKGRNSDDEWHADPAVLDASLKLDSQRWEDSYKNHNSEVLVRKAKAAMNGHGNKTTAQERVKKYE